MKSVGTELQFKDHVTTPSGGTPVMLYRYKQEYLEESPMPLSDRNGSSSSGYCSHRIKAVIDYLQTKSRFLLMTIKLSGTFCF